MVKRLEQHPQASIYGGNACGDCGTPMVHIGSSYTVKQFRSHLPVNWYQCPYCGRYKAENEQDYYWFNTLDPREVSELHSRRSPDPFTPTAGYQVSWPTTRHCPACQREYQVETIRIWKLRDDGALAAETTTTDTRLPFDARGRLSYKGSPHICYCQQIEEKTAPLTEILGMFPDHSTLLIAQEHKDERMWPAKYLIEQCGSLVTSWPYRLQISDALDALLNYGPDPDYPEAPTTMYAAWSPSAQRGTIRSRYIKPNTSERYEIRNIWAEVALHAAPLQEHNAIMRQFDSEIVD